VVPVAHPPVADGCVVVEGGRIAWVGPRSAAPQGPVDDLGDGVLLPGLVNAHTHLELSHLGHLRPAGEGAFVAWIESVVHSGCAREVRGAREKPSPAS
jgi:cytosine/adenosine deaminase-related metal-dependent hydrolase